MLGDTSTLLLSLVAALGAALLVGNALALVRPPKRPPARQRGGVQPGVSPSPPQLRKGPAIAMAVLGLLILVWAMASLLA